MILSKSKMNTSLNPRIRNHGEQVRAASRWLLRSMWLLLVMVILAAAASAPEPPPLTDEELTWLACRFLSDQPGGATYADRLASLKQRGFSESLAMRFINLANRVMVEYREFESELPDRSPSSVAALENARKQAVRRHSSAFLSRLRTEEAQLVAQYLEFLRSKTTKYHRGPGK